MPDQNQYLYIFFISQKLVCIIFTQTDILSVCVYVFDGGGRITGYSLKKIY